MGWVSDGGESFVAKNLGGCTCFVARFDSLIWNSEMNFNSPGGW